MRTTCRNDDHIASGLFRSSMDQGWVRSLPLDVSVVVRLTGSRELAQLDETFDGVSCKFKTTNRFQASDDDELGRNVRPKE